MADMLTIERIFVSKVVWSNYLKKLMSVFENVSQIKRPIRTIVAERRYEKLSFMVGSSVELEDISLIDSLNCLFTRLMLYV